jgi:hypothetical protein
MGNFQWLRRLEITRTKQPPSIIFKQKKYGDRDEWVLQNELRLSQEEFVLVNAGIAEGLQHVSKGLVSYPTPTYRPSVHEEEEEMQLEPIESLEVESLMIPVYLNQSEPFVFNGDDTILDPLDIGH